MLLSVAASLGALAALAVLFGLVLEPADDVSCNTEPLPGAYRDALAPAHLIATLVIAGGLWVLRPGRRTLGILLAVLAFAVLSLAWDAGFGLLAFVAIFAAPTVGLTLVIVLVVQTVLVTRRSASAEQAWTEHARSAALLGWAALAVGVPGAFGFAWLDAGSLFCF